MTSVRIKIAFVVEYKSLDYEREFSFSQPNTRFSACAIRAWSRQPSRKTGFCFGDRMKKVPLTKGKFAIVDDGDFDYLSQWKWWINCGYAVRAITKNGAKKYIFMHAVICNPPDGYSVDHINRDKLDNRRKNLRVCTTSQNACNIGLSKKNTSGYKGVTRFADKDKWGAQIVINQKHIFLGLFDTKEDAAKAYDDAAKKHHGIFAWLNFRK